MTFLIWMNSQFWYVSFYCIYWFLGFFLFMIKTDQAHYTVSNFSIIFHVFKKIFSCLDGVICHHNVTHFIPS